jgi:coenzyme F420-dependent glucose-6-phosphate dehydrogenase
MRFGYKLSSEERSVSQLVADARGAEDAGFDFAAISDHFHPWLDRQGQSPFVWSVLGAIAGATRSIVVGTAVTCPFIRMHPAVVAQAAATVATLLPGRFFLGLGTGERLNEHVVGRGWPDPDERRDALAASIEAIRRLWAGRVVDLDRSGVVVDAARLYSLPDAPPPIYVAASGVESAGLAARAAQGLISTAPDGEIVRAYAEAGGSGPRIGELTVCVAPSADEALTIVRERWPLPALDGEATTELATPAAFERAAARVDPDALRERVPMGPDVEAVLGAAERFREAGFSHLIVHQVGDEQARFLRFAHERLLPLLRETTSDAGSPVRTV